MPTLQLKELLQRVQDPPNDGRIRIFAMIRNGDESGTSGTGRILNGTVFPNGKVVVSWCSTKAPSSTVLYDSWTAFRAIHIDSHPSNGSVIEWLAVAD